MFIKRLTSDTSSDNEWYNEWQRMRMSDNEWQRMTLSGNIGQTFFHIIWCQCEPFVVSLHQRLLQALVIDILKIYVIYLRVILWHFLKFHGAICFLS